MIVDIIEAMRRGDIAAALAAARDTLATEPDNASAHHLLGVCLQQTGDLAGARQGFERALELAPDVAAHHFSLATLKLAEGDAAGATADATGQVDEQRMIAIDHHPGLGELPLQALRGDGIAEKQLRRVLVVDEIAARVGRGLAAALVACGGGNPGVPNPVPVLTEVPASARATARSASTQAVVSASTSGNSGFTPRQRSALYGVTQPSPRFS